MTDLEARFEQEMIEKVYRTVGRETGYWAGYFLRSIKRHGGIGAARRLLERPGVSKGLSRLAALDRLDLAMDSRDHRRGTGRSARHPRAGGRADGNV